MLCHIIVSVVHEPSHKWKKSLFCGGFGRFWLGCRSLWHRHAGAAFKNNNFLKGKKFVPKEKAMVRGRKNSS